jgi:putative chitinase
MKGDEFAQFMAQCAVETGNFKNFTELGKNHKRYEPGTKMGKILGNKVKGDGERYKGRGYIQLTGRENYARAGKALGIDLVNHPELLDNSDVAAKVAVWYWQSKVQPRVDDFSDTKQVTKPINGGLKHLKHRDDKYKEFKQAQISEVLSLTHIGKRGNLDNLPNRGKPLPKDANIKRELGELVGKMTGGLEVYRYRSGQSTAYTVFDPQTRCAQIAVSGNRYPDNPNSFIIFGVYAGPDNKTRAADLYVWLIRELGLTLVSDNKQSSGGQRVWQELQKRFGRSINIHGFDTKTNQPINLSALDSDETHASQAEIDSAEPGFKRELQNRAKNIRLVASPR